jgi:glycosyltransferase involved in cell wall biosynthesis
MITIANPSDHTKNNQAALDALAQRQRKKHRILFLNSIKFTGGGETWMVRTASALAHQGHHVRILARRGYPLEKLARDSGLSVYGIPMSGDLNPWLLWRLARFLNKEDISICVANVPRDIRIASLAKLFAPQSKLVALHQVDKPLPNRWNYKLTFNHMADALVVNSRSTKNTLETSNPWIRAQRIEVVPHGLKPTPHKPRESSPLRAELGIPREDFIFGFVGRLAAQKGILPMLDAIDIFFREYANSQLVLVGTGDLEKKARAFVLKNGWQSRVHFLGFRNDVADLMSQFDVLLVPSLWEGFGLVLIEAMAAGTPCIATRVSSIPEIVDHDENGILISPGDKDELLNALREVVCSPEILRRLGDAGQQKVREIFSEERMIAHYEQLFDGLCKRV